MTADIAWDYGTRVWRQRLLSDGPRWRLVRQIKESRSDDAPKRARSVAQVSRVDQSPAAQDTRVRFLRPAQGDEGAVYELTTSEVLAGQLWPDLQVVGRDLETVMTGLGAAVARLHVESEVAAETRGVWSPHLRRLRRHLDAEPSSFAGQVAAQLRPTVVEQLRRWLDEVPTSGVLCHGGFTLRSVFVDEELRRIEVPTGEELMLSTPELDLGWMIGELTEFEYLAALRGRDGLSYAGACRWLLDGWTSVTGTVPDQRWLDKVVALRAYLNHCDIAETTQSMDAASRHALFLTYLVERATLPGHIPTQRRHPDERLSA